MRYALDGSDRAHCPVGVASAINRIFFTVKQEVGFTVSILDCACGLALEVPIKEFEVIVVGNKLYVVVNGDLAIGNALAPRGEGVSVNDGSLEGNLRACGHELSGLGEEVSAVKPCGYGDLLECLCLFGGVGGYALVVCGKVTVVHHCLNESLVCGGLFVEISVGKLCNGIVVNSAVGTQTDGIGGENSRIYDLGHLGCGKFVVGEDDVALVSYFLCALRLEDGAVIYGIKSAIGAA